MRTSGAIVHDDQVLVANAHSFVDDQGRRREPLSSCYFTSQGTVPETQHFDFSPGSFEIPDRWTKTNDYAVVRLREPLLYARAFPIADLRQVRAGKKFLLVSANPATHDARFPSDEPVIQRCGIRRVFLATREHNDVFRGDCDITAGASGSVGLLMVNGRLHAFSTASAGGRPELDGVPYGASDESFSFHTFFSAKVLAAIYRIGSLSSGSRERLAGR